MATGQIDQVDKVDVPLEAIQIVDQQVMKKLPEGTAVTSITPHGASFWTRTACLNTEYNGQPVRYFLKACHGQRGRDMVSSEFTAMTAIHALTPSFVPKPIAWGTYDSLTDVHFFLCEFRNMITTLPDLSTFPAMLADLHRRGGTCSSSSADGKRFGFSVTTFHGNVPVEHGWSDTWEEYFTRTTRTLLQKEQETRGHSQEMARLSQPFLEKVIPRLLRPMETGGRSIMPALIHGDLWHGNAAMDAATNRPIIFDAASFYAHNEYELAVWRQPWNDIGEAYRNKYCQHFPPAFPVQDFEDRGKLYGTRVNMLDSILYTEDTNYRQMLIKSMKELVEKFTGGYEEWAESQASEGL